MDICVAAQKTRTEEMPEAEIVGTPYHVPEIRVYLTDEETGGPYADHDVVIQYYWSWDVLKATDQTNNMSNILALKVNARTDGTGLILVASRIIVPRRPVAPEGAEFSEPRFQSVEIIAKDARHNCGMPIYYAQVNLNDLVTEVHRTVMLYPRPKSH